eukprot:762970-Alexandrium_andersonii.AAC.1
MAPQPTSPPSRRRRHQPRPPSSRPWLNAMGAVRRYLGGAGGRPRSWRSPHGGGKDRQTKRLRK